MLKGNGLLRAGFVRRLLQRKTGHRSWESLYHALSYRFRNEAFLHQALTHRSSLSNHSDHPVSNERLEFLGDAVLGMVVTDALFHHFPDASEGQLTKAKSLVVSREMLAKKARSIHLGRYLLLGKGEEHSGGRDRPSILSDAFEALIGAIYLDGGLLAVSRIIHNQLLNDMDRLLTHKFYRNYKSWLLEHVQGEGNVHPVYDVLQEQGPDHKKEFVICVRVNGNVLGTGKGTSKKKAEQEAAKQAIQNLGLYGDGKLQQ